jgi:hypothetical protein
LIVSPSTGSTTATKNSNKNINNNKRSRNLPLPPPTVTSKKNSTSEPLGHRKYQNSRPQSERDVPDLYKLQRSSTTENNLTGLRRGLQTGSSKFVQIGLDIVGGATCDQVSWIGIVSGTRTINGEDNGIIKTRKYDQSQATWVPTFEDLVIDVAKASTGTI